MARYLRASGLNGDVYLRSTSQQVAPGLYLRSTLNGTDRYLRDNRNTITSTPSLYLRTTLNGTDRYLRDNRSYSSSPLSAYLRTTLNGTDRYLRNNFSQGTAPPVVAPITFKGVGFLIYSLDGSFFKL